MTDAAGPRELAVVKVGGAVAHEAVGAARAMSAAGHAVCIVHGAGPQISLQMREMGLAVQFVRGRRVTSAAGLAVVRRSLQEVNQRLCAAIGRRAVGFMGDDIGLPARQIPGLGLVGEPLPACPEAVVTALGGGRIPVIAPLAAGPLNVNADEAAACLAVGMAAGRLHFVSDVPGVLLDRVVLSSISADEAERLLDSRQLEGGIVPKLRAAVVAARAQLRVQIGATAVLGSP